ncbi:MAG: hypothetical protein FGM32_00635 [Candidatus Kapabacteria bacterium]|nr:hypothetical protein [Candidatus Kapabacteria bacterium]
MTTLETLSTAAGRALLRDLHQELRFDKQMGSLPTLVLLWRICTRESDLFRTVNRDVTVLHPLGLLSGTSLWMQEIVNRFYYAPINAFVYMGAAFLLVAVGLNRVRVIDTPGLLVAAIVTEALLLLLLFLVMFFTPPAESDEMHGNGEGGSTSQELIRELGEIGRDYAAMAVQLETISVTLHEVVERQDTMTQQLRESVQAAVGAVAPNPELMASMKMNTKALAEFTESVSALSERLQAVERQEVERLVRQELERILSRNIVDRNGPASAS